MRPLHLAALAVLCLAAFAAGQQTKEDTRDPSTKRAGNLMASLEMSELLARGASLGVKPDPDLKASTPAISDALSAIVDDPVATAKFADSSLQGFFMEKAGAKSAAQVSQTADETRVRLEALQIAQNARIIALLAQLNSQKK
jgi:hypothetical protein